jgi:predicted glutamine amidotransferase
MCELFAMSSRQPATVNFSLEEFALHGGLSGPHKDGWGIAYLQQRDAWVIKEAAPASSSSLVRFIESHHLASTLVISHIRQATRGPVCFENTQPFRRELAGRAQIFAHNGDLPDIRSCGELRLGRRRPMGTTDSEYAFCALLNALEGLWLDTAGVPEIGDRLAIVSRFASSLRALGPANFLYWDGDALFAHGHERRPAGGGLRPPGLHTLSRTCPFEPSAPRIEGLRVIPGSGEQEVFLAASVPLTDEDWQPLGGGEIAVVWQGSTRTHLPGRDWSRMERNTPPRGPRSRTEGRTRT